MRDRCAAVRHSDDRRAVVQSRASSWAPGPGAPSVPRLSHEWLSRVTGAFIRELRPLLPRQMTTQRRFTAVLFRAGPECATPLLRAPSVRSWRLARFPWQRARAWVCSTARFHTRRARSARPYLSRPVRRTSPGRAQKKGPITSCGSRPAASAAANQAPRMDAGVIQIYRRELVRIR